MHPHYILMDNISTSYKVLRSLHKAFAIDDRTRRSFDHRCSGDDVALQCNDASNLSTRPILLLLALIAGLKLNSFLSFIIVCLFVGLLQGMEPLTIGLRCSDVWKAFTLNAIPQHNESDATRIRDNPKCPFARMCRESSVY